MGHQQSSNKGQSSHERSLSSHARSSHNGEFVLEKSIFNNIFEKDIRRVYIYKKTERLAKALLLIAPAFAQSAALRNRIETIAIGLLDGAVAPTTLARPALSRELLALSSVLSIAKTGGLLSPMNAEMIAHEAHSLLQEIAAYEEPRLFLDEAPTLSGIAKSALKKESDLVAPVRQARPALPHQPKADKGHLKDNTSDKGHLSERRDTILSVIARKGSVSIKDISTLIRGVSEKTIQRELGALIASGKVQKSGERRWSTYSLS